MFEQKRRLVLVTWQATDGPSLVGMWPVWALVLVVVFT